MNQSVVRMMMTKIPIPISLQISYSLGKNKYDNQPKQINSENFDSFQETILTSRSAKKGEIYFTSAFTKGFHKNIQKYPNKGHYRLKNLALPRAFQPLDFDGFTNRDAYLKTREFLQKFRGFGYETWSYSQEAPRARAVLALSRPVNEPESLKIGFLVEKQITDAIGVEMIKFDKSVYQLAQPVYSPPINAKDYKFTGELVNVDELLNESRLVDFGTVGKISKPKYLQQLELNNIQIAKSPPPDESPRQIACLKEMLNYIDANCDYITYRRVVWAILSTGWECAEDLAYDWSKSSPEVFNEQVFWDLANGFDPDRIDCPSIGSIKFLAEDGGWRE